MRPDLGFRLLHYLTLALAGACLIVAEGPFLPDLHLALAPFLVLVALAFLLDGRWVLPAWGANLLGLGIAGGSAWWVVRRLREADSWVEQVSLPAAVVPHLGPVVLALLLVKLFRPRSGRD